MKKQLLLIILLLLQILIVFAPSAPTSFPGASWGYYARLVINSDYIDTDLVNFTVLVDINSTVAGRCNANASDIRFVATNNITEYDYEIELWDASATSYVWVKIPRIESNTHTYFYLYYNNTGASDNQSSVDTWDVNYTGVWHLNESGSTYNDSTSNFNNGTGTSIANNASGVVAYCTSTDANTDRIAIPSSTSLNITGNITVSGWIYLSMNDGNMMVMSKEYREAFELYHPTTDNRWRWYRNNVKIEMTWAELRGVWFYVSVTDDGTQSLCYINGSQIGGVHASLTGVTGISDLNLMNRPGDNQGMEMSLDEARLSNIARNASWLKAEYNSIATDTFLVWSSQLIINCYDENTSLALSNWDVFITNQAGTETYESNGNTNPLILNPGTVPFGDNIAIKVNRTGYDFRVYYVDLTPTTYYTLDAFLPPTNISELYLLSVVDEIDSPISDATMVLKQYINGSYEDVSVRLTDANGQVAVYLIPGSWNSLYKVIITKEGYETEYADFIPSDEIFTHTFRMDFAEGDPTEPYVESEEITFEGYISGTTLYINYTDNLDETLNSQIHIYEKNYSTLTTTLLASNSNTTNSSYQFTTTINISNAHIVYLHYNHTTFGYIVHSLYFEATNVTTFTNQTVFDDLFDLNYGSNPFGWSNVFMWLFLCGCLFSFGQRGSGISLMFTGGLFLFINYVVGFNTVFVTLWSGGLPILFIIVGVMVLWRNAKKEGW